MSRRGRNADWHVTAAVTAYMLSCCVNGCYGLIFIMSVSQKATLPPVEAETTAKGNPLSSSVEVLVDSAPVIKDRKVGMLLNHPSINQFLSLQGLSRMSIIV